MNCNGSNDLNLTSGDLSVFAKMGVDEKLLAEAGVHRIAHTEARDAGFLHAGDMGGIVFPYVGRNGQKVGSRLRRDNPESDSDGKPKDKYITAYGDRKHLYFPPEGWALLDTDCTITLVEAEKSALAITALARRKNLQLLPVAMGGCWGWRGRIGKVSTANGHTIDERGPVPDLDLLAKAGRDVVISLDSNASSKPSVRAARRELATYLSALGVRVRIAEVPQMEGVNGPDDLIQHAGDEALLQVIDAAHPAAGVAMAEAEQAVMQLTQKSSVAEVELAYGAIALVENRQHRQVLVDRASATLKINGKKISKTVEDLVRSYVLESQAAAAHAKRSAQMRREVVPSELFAMLERFFSTHLYLPKDAALVLALWAMNTYTFDLFQTTPYLLLESATPGCGKSSIFELLAKVCSKAQVLVSPTEAVLYRLIDQRKPTLLLDEAEQFRAGGDRMDFIRAVAHAGYKRGGTVFRCKDRGEGMDDFDVYCPKAFASIGGLTGALLDRCIVIHLEKKPPSVSLASNLDFVLSREAEPIRELLEAYALQVAEPLTDFYRKQPDAGYWPELRNREAELWTPLLVHARAAKVEERALNAALRFSHQKQQSQSADEHVARARELLETLLEMESTTFAPHYLIEEKRLNLKLAWGAHLDKHRTPTAEAAAIGRFLQSFGLTSTHSRHGATYNRQETIKKLRTHLPAATMDLSPEPTTPEISIPSIPVQIGIDSDWLDEPVTP